MTDRLLVVAAHPDDEVLGCGGTIARLHELGCAIRVIFLADGITARYAIHEHTSALVQGQIAARNECALKALSILGVDADSIYFSSNPACRLDQVLLINLVKEIENHIAEFAPTLLYTHWSHDTNIDHCLVHRAVLAATRPLNIPFLKRIVAFEVLSSTEWNTTVAFTANVFQDISRYMERKLEAMRAYGEEMRQAPHPRSAETIRSLARYRGAQVGVSYAEAFNLIRSLEA